MENRIEVKTAFGMLIAEPSSDPDYPGVWISIMRPRTEEGEEGEYEANLALVESMQDSEFPDSKKKLRVLVWANPDREDYTEEITTEFKPN